MEMGFIKGATLKVKRVAPLGDPIEIRIKGYYISLRKEEAKNIEIMQNLEISRFW
jgi:ferrous iron transport protein A